MISEPDLSPLVGCEVTRLCLDYQVQLLLAGYDKTGHESVSATLLMECTMILTRPDQRVTVNPDTAEGYGTVVELLRLVVASVIMNPGSRLEIGFSDGTHLTAVPGPTV